MNILNFVDKIIGYYFRLSHIIKFLLQFYQRVDENLTY